MLPHKHYFFYLIVTLTAIANASLVARGEDSDPCREILDNAKVSHPLVAKYFESNFLLSSSNELSGAQFIALEIGSNVNKEVYECLKAYELSSVQFRLSSGFAIDYPFVKNKRTSKIVSSLHYAFNGFTIGELAIGASPYTYPDGPGGIVRASVRSACNCGDEIDALTWEDLDTTTPKLKFPILVDLDPSLFRDFNILGIIRFSEASTESLLPMKEGCVRELLKRDLDIWLTLIEGNSYVQSDEVIRAVSPDIRSQGIEIDELYPWRGKWDFTVIGNDRSTYHGSARIEFSYPSSNVLGCKIAYKTKTQDSLILGKWGYVLGPGGEEVFTEYFSR